MSAVKLFREHELAFRTQYAELKERVLAAGPLLPGTPGSLVLRSGTGYGYWYRCFYSVPGKQREELICKEDEADTLNEMRERIAFAEWCAIQVPNLRKLGFQVADKTVARVLMELHNHRTFEAGLVLVGTLGYMAWLNELGAIAISVRTQDVDLARRQPLRLTAPLPLQSALEATGLPFVSVPGLPSTNPSTALKLPGAQGLRIDLLAPGMPLGGIVPLPELAWAAQAVPFYDYLLEAPESAALLAGWQCIPVRLPQAGRFVWHKLYASTHRKGFPEKSVKDRQQALVLAAVLSEADPLALQRAFDDAPTAMTASIKPLLGSLCKALDAHPELKDILTTCLK